MIKEFAEVLRKKLHEEISNYTGDLERGQPASYDEYKKLVGRIEGLRIAEKSLMELVKRVETDDDDDA